MNFFLLCTLIAAAAAASTKTNPNNLFVLDKPLLVSAVSTKTNQNYLFVLDKPLLTYEEISKNPSPTNKHMFTNEELSNIPSPPPFIYNECQIKHPLDKCFKSSFIQKAKCARRNLASWLAHYSSDGKTGFNDEIYGIVQRDQHWNRLDREYDLEDFIYRTVNDKSSVAHRIARQLCGVDKSSWPKPVTEITFYKNGQIYNCMTYKVRGFWRSLGNFVWPRCKIIKD